MKKITLVALLCALFTAPFAKAQEVTYAEDPSQGYLFNRFQDNWFIHAEAGGGVLMGPYDSHAGFGDRLGWSFQLNFGKWFSPVIGFRLGVDCYQAKGVLHPDHDMDIVGTRWDEPINGTYKHRVWQLGPTFDIMLNLTNWWCGYKPGRVYNAILYTGAACNIAFSRDLSEFMQTAKKGDWKYSGSNNLTWRVGFLNTFAVSRQVDLTLDLRFDLCEEHFDGSVDKRQPYAAALLGFVYKFKKREWNAPVTAICPTWKYTDAEGDALAARLKAAEAKIADLEKQLRDCLNRKPQVIEQPAGPLATVYFPINKSNITGVQAKVVDAVANVMSDTDKNYVLTGWADNYTGTAARNVTLRKERVANVKKALVKKGVAENRLDAQINDGNLTNFGAKCASLDRAVTVQEAK